MVCFAPWELLTRFDQSAIMMPSLQLWVCPGNRTVRQNPTRTFLPDSEIKAPVGSCVPQRGLSSPQGAVSVPWRFMGPSSFFSIQQIWLLSTRTSPMSDLMRPQTPTGVRIWVGLGTALDGEVSSIHHRPPLAWHKRRHQLPNNEQHLPGT